MTDRSASWVPGDFIPPTGLDRPEFRLRPLGPEHNESDYAAWTSSMEHVRATPGFQESTWPHPMTLEELSAEFDISRERVRQIEVRAFEKVQDAVKAAAKRQAQSLRTIEAEAH